MSNMSYCRFRNTLHDLQDCADALKEGKKLSPEEARAAKRLIEKCSDILVIVAHARSVDVEDLFDKDSEIIAFVDGLDSEQE
jgi:L-asparaginase II